MDGDPLSLGINSIPDLSGVFFVENPALLSVFCQTGMLEKLSGGCQSATAKHQYILTMGSLAVRIQCTSRGIPPSTLLVRMEECIFSYGMEECEDGGMHFFLMAYMVQASEVYVQKWSDHENVMYRPVYKGLWSEVYSVQCNCHMYSM